MSGAKLSGAKLYYNQMGDELTLFLEVFSKIEKAGGQATLSVATVGGKTKVKLEIATNPAPPTGSTPTSSLTGRRHRRRSARARARRNQRAAAHQAALAEAATRASLDRPPPRPLRLLPSPPPKSGRRQVIPWRGWTRRPSPPSMHNVLFRLYVFLPTKQAETYLRIFVLIYYLINICPSVQLEGRHEF